MKKRLALLLTFAMVFTSLPVNSLSVKAEAKNTVAEYQTDSDILSENSGGGYTDSEDEVASAQNDGIALHGGGYEEDDKTVESVEPKTTFSEAGYYPASLEYALNNYQVDITYTDGTTSYITGWRGGSDWRSEDNPYYYYGETSNYQTRLFMFFYDSDGNLVNLDDVTVPVGEYKIKIFDNDDPTTTPLLQGVKFKVLDPSSLMKTPKEDQASFSSEDYKTYEELWYKLPSGLEGTYIFTPADWKSQSHFIGIWMYEDGVATQVYDGYYGWLAESFSYLFDGTEENFYLVLGETYDSATISGSISWQKKKVIGSLELHTADSYKAWNGDIESNTSVTVTYQDDTKEIVNTWDTTYFYLEDWTSVEVLKATTKNADTLYLGMFDSKGKLIDAYNRSTFSFDVNETSWKAWVKDAESICATGTMTISKPSVKTITLAEGNYENFTISQDKEVYYQFSVSETQKVEIVNSSSESMSVYYFKKQEDGTWSRSVSSLLDGSKSDTDYVDAGEYLVILETDTAAEGTLGLYVKGTTKSASLSAVTVSASDRATWTKIPVTMSFVGTDGTTTVGTQVIQSWSATYSSPTTLYATTKYNERIIGVLYQGNTQVSIPSLGAEYEAYLEEMYGSNVTKEQLEQFCAENNIKYQPLDPGSYTLKFYLSSVGDANLIGSASVTVTEAVDNETGGNGANAGDGNGSSGNTTCSSHKWSAWTTKSAATVFAAEVQQHTCSICGETETRSNGSKLKATVSLPGNLSALTIKKGKTATATLTMAAGDSLVSCTSTNTKILKVKSVNKKTGAVTLKAVKAGDAKISIKLKSDSSKTYTYKVKVTTGTVKTTKLTGVATKKTLAKKGATFSVKPTVVPFTSTQSVTYKSSNKKVATVTAKGVVKAVAPGTAKITIQSGSKKTTCTVTVAGIANVKTSLKIKAKKTTTLKPKLYGISGKATYTSSNVKVATVTAGGKIKALKKGTTTITVKAGSYSCKCKVTVK